MQELKLKYYKLMIELCQHEEDYLAICQHYREVFNTPQVQKGEELWKEVWLLCDLVISITHGSGI